MYLEEHISWLRGWVADKKASTALDPEPLDLKLEHTMRVLLNTRRIIKDLPALYEKPLTLAALYHDIARFDQYLRFQTFKDAQSFNHGFEGVKIVKRLNRLRCLEKNEANLALAAICLHNRAELPKGLPEDFQTACNVIRDADKLDILRVMDAHLAGPKPYNPTFVLSLPDSPKPGDKAFLQQALAGKVGSYASLRTVNDFRMLLGTWFYDLHSPIAQKIFITEKHGANIVSGLPEDGHYGPARDKLLGDFAKYE